MRRIALFSLPFLLAAACAPPAPPAVAPAPVPGLEAGVDEVFADWDSDRTPGCVVAADLAGNTVLAGAYGMADLEHGIPNTPETILEAGSVSKQFAAAAVVLLALDGALSLDDDVRRYVPELPDYGTPITIRHLFNHTSGLRDWGAVAALSGWGRSERTHNHAHVLDIVSRQSALNYPPGEAYSYTNSGYNLLAIIVERVSGSSFADYSRERIFEPLGLTSTQWRDDYRRLVPGRATAYSPQGEGFRINQPIEHVHGNGGLLSTVGDLLRWDRALASGEIGGPEFVEVMHQQGVLNDGRAISYASGVQIGSRRGVPQVSHTGATSGYRAYLARYPDQELAVALLCNVSAANPGQLGNAVSDLFLEEVGPAWEAPAAPEGIQLSRAELEEKVGLYRDAVTGEPLRLVLDDDNGGRALRIEDGAWLIPVSPTTFHVGNGDRTFDFERMPDITRPRIRATIREADQPPHEIAAYEPVEAFSPPAEGLEVYTGSFHSEDAETTLRVTVEEGELVVNRRPDDRITLNPVYADVFGSRLGLVRFYRDARGEVGELGLRQGRVHDMRFQRREVDDDASTSIGPEGAGDGEDEENVAMRTPDQAEEEPEGWRDRWNVSAELSYTGQSGNSDLRLFSGGIKARHLDRDHFRLDASLESRYGRSGEDVVARRHEGSVAFDLHPSRALTPFLFTSVQQDPVRRLGLRLSSGAGAKYTVEQPRRSPDVSISLALLHDYDRVRPAAEDESTEVRHRARWSLEMRGGRRMNENILLEHRSHYQPVWDEPGDYLLRTNTGTKANITERLALSLSYRFDRNARPPAGVDSDDHILQTGIAIDL